MKKGLFASVLGLQMLALSAMAASESSSLHGFITVGAIMHQEDSIRFGANSEKGVDWLTPSVAGVQARYQFSPLWSATAQVVVAPDEQDQRRLGIRADWFFASYQATDEVQIRLGKLRLPLLMFSEKINVGVGYPMTFLPDEVYSLMPVNSYNGVDVLWRQEVGSVELTVQPYVGLIDFYYRNVERTAGAPQNYYAMSLDNIKGINLHLSALNERLKLRAGYLHAELNDRSGWTDGLVNMGYTGYALNNTPSTRASLGMSWMNNGWMFVSEITRREIEQAGISNATGWYALLGKRWGDWMPYISYASVNSDRSKVKNIPRPIFEQNTIALGMNYHLDKQSLIKAEWRRVSVGKDNDSQRASVFRETGMPLSDIEFDVLQFTYNYYF